MTYDESLSCDSTLGICGISAEEDTLLYKRDKKKIELYIFIDPLCPECWAFEPTLKKLFLEYGQYFSIRFFVAAQLENWNTREHKQPKVQKYLADYYDKTASKTGMSCDGDIWLENVLDSPYMPSLAIKASEMQGKQLATSFFRRIRELLFLSKQNITDENVLIQCAEDVGLDITEFKRDMASPCAARALQCDVKTTKEMEIDYAPTFVFFNDRVEDGGLKISGLYPYQVYVDILTEMLGERPVPSDQLPLETFLQKYEFVATKEVAVVFDWTEKETEAHLKKLVLQRKIEHVPVKHGSFWKYLSSVPTGSKKPSPIK